MKPLLAFIQKEFYHLFRDLRTLLILIGMPIAFLVIFGFALSTEIKNAKIAILDNAKDYHSIRITNKVLSSGYFQLYRNLHSYHELENAFRDGKIKMAIVFPVSFSDNFTHNGKSQIQLVGDASDPNTAITLINYASSIIRDYQLSAQGPANVPLQINTETKMRYNPELKSAYGFVPGVIVLVLMLISAMMTSVTIAREKEFGNMEILLVSPLRPYQIVLGKVIPYFLLSILNTTILLVMGVFMFGVPILGNIWLLIGECLLFGLTALSLGIFISSKADSQMLAMFISLIALMMPTVILTGFIFPVESMPSVLRYISNILPATWFMIILKNVMLKGTGLELLWKPTLVLAGMTLFFMVLSIKNFKNRLS